MAQNREQLVPWVLEAITALGGAAPILEIAKEIWKRHQAELEADEKLKFQWHYDMRWAGDILAKQDKIDRKSKRGVWKIV